MATYTYYYNRKKPNYRLVIETGAALPERLEKDDWLFKEERPYGRVHKAIMAGVQTRGYGSYQLDLTPHDIPSA